MPQKFQQAHLHDQMFGTPSTSYHRTKNKPELLKKYNEPRLGMLVLLNKHFDGQINQNELYLTALN